MSGARNATSMNNISQSQARSWSPPCCCRSYARRSMDSSRWLGNALGTLFWTCTQFSMTEEQLCNSLNCSQQRESSHNLTYHFPTWIARGAFVVTSTYSSLGGMSASWSFGFPRTISANHKVWQSIERQEPRELATMLRQRVVYSNDLADDDGTPLLIVSWSHRACLVQ